MSTSGVATAEQPRKVPRLTLSLGWAVLPSLLAIGLYAAGAQWPALLVIAATIGVSLLIVPDAATWLMAFVLYTNAAVVAIRFHGVPRAAAAGTVAILLVPLFHYVVRKRKPIVITRAVPFMVLFLLVQIVGITIADGKELAVEVTFTTLAEGLVLYLLITNVIHSEAVLRGVVWTLLLAGTLLGAASTAQQVTRNFRNNYGGFAQGHKGEMALVSTDETEGSRSAGPIGEKNYYAQFMLMLLPLALLPMLTERRLYLRCAAGLAAAMIALAIAFTASRGAAIAFVAMLMAMIYLRQVNWRHVLLLVAASSVIVLAAPQFRERLLSIVSLVNVLEGQAEVRAIDKSTQGRLSEMLAAGLVFLDHPVLGVGPGNFRLHFLDKADALGFQVHGEERLAHCAVLEIAAEHGVLGLFCIIAVVLISFRDLVMAHHLAVDRQSKALIMSFQLSLVVLVSSSFFLSFAYVRYYYFMLALGAAAARIGRENGQIRRLSELDEK